MFLFLTFLYRAIFTVAMKPYNKLHSLLKREGRSVRERGERERTLFTGIAGKLLAWFTGWWGESCIHWNLPPKCLLYSSSWIYNIVGRGLGGDEIILLLLLLSECVLKGRPCASSLTFMPMVKPSGEANEAFSCFRIARRNLWSSVIGYKLSSASAYHWPGI